MPDLTSAEHVSWAKKNEATFKAMGGAKSKWPDWTATVLFYIGVHEVQAFLVDRGIRPKNHIERNAALRSQWKSTIWPPYESLQQLSSDARYKCITPTEERLNRAILMLAKLRATIQSERDAASETGVEPPEK